MEPRTQAAVLAGKLTRAATRRAGRGGTALPGLVAERIDKDVVARLADQLHAAVLVTGTNGKTTTARMLAGMLEREGYPVVHNRAGSNLMRGIAAALIEAAGPTAGLRPNSVAVFETDEATLTEAAVATAPRVLVIGNLLRDQLDRYGEIDAIRDRWVESIAALPQSTVLVLNADDPSVASLADGARGPVVFFGVEDASVAMPPDRATQHAADALWDPSTGADYVYERRFFAHLGHWRCPTIGRERPRPDVAAHNIDLSAADATPFEIVSGNETVPLRLPLSGLYNVYNALGATAAARVLGVDPVAAAESLEEMRPVFGRQERLSVNGHEVQILLGKNPAGMNEALRTLEPRPGAAVPGHHLLVLLNDDVADGTDVSWIWDTDWENIAPYAASVVVGGRRAADMALRLQYVGFANLIEPSHHDIGLALGQALDALPPGAPLVVLPTYTALLDVRERLAAMAGAQRIWEGA